MKLAVMWKGLPTILVLMYGVLFGQAKVEDANHDRFIGAWRLASLEEPDANGSLHKADCTGLLVYSGDGHISVQVMYTKPQATSDATAPVQYAQGGYEASFGTYKINDARTFTFHVEGALVRSLIDKDLSRDYEFSGNQLIIKPHDPNERWRVVWERSKAPTLVP